MNRTFVRAAGVFVLALIPFLSAQAAEKKTAALDTQASVLLWDAKKVTGAHNGSVMLKSGKVSLADGKVTGGEFEIDMTSIRALDLQGGGRDKLEAHLKSDDFFAVDKFPTAKFKITALKPAAADPGATHEVTGDLTVKGVTHSETFPAVIKVAGSRAEATAAVVVDRTKYGVKYGSGKFFENLGDKMIDDHFRIDLKLVTK